MKFYKDNKYLLPQQHTTNEDFSQDFTFVFLQEGSYTLAIEDIEMRGENAEMPIQVTPEFSSVIPIIALAITFVIFVSSSMKLKSK